MIAVEGGRKVGRGRRGLVSRAKAPAGTVYYGEENVVIGGLVAMVCGFDNYPGWTANLERRLPPHCRRCRVVGTSEKVVTVLSARFW